MVNGWFPTKWIVQEAIEPPETILTVAAKGVKEMPRGSPVRQLDIGLTMPLKAEATVDARISMLYLKFDRPLGRRVP